MAVDWRPAPDTAGLKLKWGDGWIEDFPEGEFADECEDRYGSIKMYRRGEARPVTVEYSLTVAKREALLDYGGRFARANAAPARDIYLGQTRIQFTDETRSSVEAVLWRDEGGKVFGAYDIQCSWQQSTGSGKVSPFRLPKVPGDSRLRAPISAVLRPGQVRFRAQLLGVYGSACAITGCRLADALDAAHIVPFRGPQYDHVQNGIIMRSDLHRLFDGMHFSVDPQSQRVVLSSELRGHPDYAALQDRPLSVPRRVDWRPAAAALRDHWRRFTLARSESTR